MILISRNGIKILIIISDTCIITTEFYKSQLLRRLRKKYFKFKTSLSEFKDK